MAFTSLSYSFLHFSTSSLSSFFSAKLYFSLPLKNFSHFNVQQLSTLKHKSFCFVFTSSFKNNFENENIRKNHFHSILLNFEYEGEGGVGFFLQKKPAWMTHGCVLHSVRGIQEKVMQ